MKTIFRAALLAVGLALAGVNVATASTPSVGADPGNVLEHHSTAHSIGTCGGHPCPRKPSPQQGG